MTNAPHILRLRDELGPELIGRQAGERLRQVVVGRTATGIVVVDLEGLVLMTPSVADELFAKLPDDVVREQRVRFANASEEIRALARDTRGLRVAAPR